MMYKPECEERLFNVKIPNEKLRKRVPTSRYPRVGDRGWGHIGAAPAHLCSFHSQVRFPLFIYHSLKLVYFFYNNQETAVGFHAMHTLLFCSLSKELQDFLLHSHQLLLYDTYYYSCISVLF